jgi:hypothetical protein
MIKDNKPISTVSTRRVKKINNPKGIYEKQKERVRNVKKFLEVVLLF